MHVDQSLEELTLHVRDEDGSRIIQVCGHQTVYNSNRFKQTVEEALEKGSRRLVVDLGRCLYIDSAGLGVLVTSKFQCAKRGGTMVLCCIPDDIIRNFRLAKIDKIIPIYKTLSDALESQ